MPCHPPVRPQPEPAPARSRPHFCFLLPSSLPSSSPSTQPHQPASLRPSLSAATCRGAVAPAISSPAVLLLPSFFIKLPKQKSVEVVTWRAPSLPTQLFYSTITGRAQLAAPLLLHPIRRRPPTPVSRRGPSAAIGSIGKQSMKMNYPVPSPSLTNK